MLLLDRIVEVQALLQLRCHCLQTVPLALARQRGLEGLEGVFRRGGRRLRVSLDPVFLLDYSLYKIFSPSLILNRFSVLFC